MEILKEIENGIFARCLISGELIVELGLDQGKIEKILGEMDGGDIIGVKVDFISDYNRWEICGKLRLPNKELGETEKKDWESKSFKALQNIIQFVLFEGGNRCVIAMGNEKGESNGNI